MIDWLDLQRQWWKIHWQLLKQISIIAILCDGNYTDYITTSIKPNNHWHLARTLLNLVPLKLSLVGSILRRYDHAQTVQRRPDDRESSAAVVLFTLYLYSGAVYFDRSGKSTQRARRAEGHGTGQWGEREKNCTLLISIHLKQIGVHV